MLDTLVNLLDFIQAWAKIIIEKLANLAAWKEETEEKLSSLYEEESKEEEE
ncbi:MAG: hypothetical protein J1E34_00430 [Oscillospiraceae bacterium]|nr:hypothetical protein [Oscillospiraceae bacterium]